MSIVNLGIVAHVDAGKTSLTERLLYAAGVIDEIGSVDAGSTQTDSMELERQRGITIRSAVVSFAIDGVTVNLIDTPGHPDFIAEVERALRVLDGAVLVISAVEGVQAQTRVLMRTLQRLRIPTLLFVNKVDRAGARDEPLLASIAEKLTPAVVPVVRVRDLGTPRASTAPCGPQDAAHTARLAELLAEQDAALLATYVRDEAAIPYQRLRAELAAQTRRGLVYPVFFGSAVTGTGVDLLMAGLTELLPTAGGDPAGPLSGTVFKVERDRVREKVAYIRMFSGTLHTRDRIPFGEGEDGKVTAINVVEGGSAVRRACVTAGQIGKVSGLSRVRIGDAIGAPAAANGQRQLFAPPTLETVVVPARPADRGALHAALAQLAEQDPLINLRQDDTRQELSVSLYGEVQKEVIGSTLRDDYGIEVTFEETTTIYIERPVGTGEAVEYMGRDGNPYLATLGLRVEPAPGEAAGEVRLAVVLESIPMFVYRTVADFRAAIRDTVRATLNQGLYGWQVRDYQVTVTQCGYNSPGSTAGDFRKLLPLVLMSALKQAATVVCEPIHHFHLDGPADALSPAMAVLARLGAVPETGTARGSTCTVSGFIAADRIRELERRLPALTHGEGTLETRFDRYEPLRGTPPVRPRSDHNPLDRKEYLLGVERRVTVRRAD